ncbi:MAG: pyridoxamine 5'-phosphate oxidase family protein [Candidatus Thorarchaeota archaeon]
MTKKNITAQFIEKKIRSKSFGVLSTVSPKGWAQSTGVLYGVSESSDPLNLYIITGRDYTKIKNIMKNQKVSFVITFPHYYFRFAPASTIQFQSIAEILPVKDEKALKAFSKKRVLKMMIDLTEEDYEKEELVFIKLTPKKRYNCYGIGFSIIELARNTEAGFFVVDIH